MVTKIHFCPCCVSEIVNGFPFSLIDFMCDTVYMYVHTYVHTVFVQIKVLAQIEAGFEYTPGTPAI